MYVYVCLKKSANTQTHTHMRERDTCMHCVLLHAKIYIHIHADIEMDSRHSGRMTLVFQGLYDALSSWLRDSDKVNCRKSLSKQNVRQVLTSRTLLPEAQRRETSSPTRVQTVAQEGSAKKAFVKQHRCFHHKVAA